LQTGKLANWQTETGKLAKMTKWQMATGKMANCQIGKLANWLNGKIEK
jgi:hypothetical protein